MINNDYYFNSITLISFYLVYFLDFFKIYIESFIKTTLNAMAKSGSKPEDGQATVNNPYITTAHTTNAPTLPIRDIYSINLNDYNSSSHLYPIQQTSRTSNQPLPPITKITQPPRNGFKFNVNFLIIPLVAFTVVAVAAIACGIVFGILYQPEKTVKNTRPPPQNNIDLNKDETDKALPTGPAYTGTITATGI